MPVDWSKRRFLSVIFTVLSFEKLTYKTFSIYIIIMVIPIINAATSVNLKTGWGGMASRNDVMKKQYTLFWSALQSSLDFSFFGFQYFSWYDFLLFIQTISPILIG